MSSLTSSVRPQEDGVLIVVGPCGFCFGVERTVRRIKELLESGCTVLTDGPVVHNEGVIDSLRRLGLKTLEEAPVHRDVNYSDRKVIFVVRAHGLPPDVLDRVRRQVENVQIVDLTCPIVKSNIELAQQLSDDGYTLVVFGHRNHPEMIALAGHVPGAIVSVDPFVVDSPKVAVMSQTTSSSLEFENFVEQIKLRNAGREVVVKDTICKVTKSREMAAKWLAERSDLVVVVGGKNSSNTRKLHEISSKSAESILIGNVDELASRIEDVYLRVEKKNLQGRRNAFVVGVMSGTSTPHEDVEDVVRFLREKLGGRELSMAELEKSANLQEQLNGEHEQDQSENFEELLNKAESAGRPIRRGSVVEAVVIDVTQTGLTVDLGGKLTGILPLEECFREVGEYRIGEKVKVRIEKINEEEGTAAVSERKPMEGVVREAVERAFRESRSVTGKVVERTKGGYRVVLENVVEAFLPGSEAGIRPDDEIPKGKLEFAILNLERRGRKLNVVVSRKKLFEKRISQFFEQHKPGDVVEGTVESVDDRGAFVRIGDVITGYVPNREVSYNTSLTAKDVLTVGKSGKFAIRELDPARRRVVLSIKALLPDPWENVDRRYPVGQTFSGVVSSVKPFGFFVKLEDGVEGLVPLSEVFWGKPGKIDDVVSVGDVVKVQVLNINPEKRQMTLSYRSALGDPWSNIEERFPVGNVVPGKVIKTLTNGAIIELDKNITAFCNISELSWNFVENAEDVVKEGDKVKVRILEVDKEGRRIRASIKKATQNPWEVFASNHKEGDVVNAKVLKRVEKGYIGICENVEVYIPANQVYGELSNGDEVTGKIIKLEPQKEIYKIVVSPKAYENEMALKQADSGGVPSGVNVSIPEERVEDVGRLVERANGEGEVGEKE